MWRRWILAGLLMTVTLVGAQGARLGLPAEIADYFTWERANPQKDLEESAHPLVKDIYIDELAAQSALEASFPYGEGSTLIKERMNPETLQVTTLYAMRKVAGFDPDNGDWQYAVFEREDAGDFGGGWMSAENAGMCVGCHVKAKDTDYTFLSYLGE
ncbi:MAG: hypothetical protein AVDCRST_MAG86-341 [uncultured Truepera sp.]|uniref:Cytochrome P460 domain-containing protein n=1 Tax=uncultured Truepera sp. TaxID=543023 RepID=A0A6J4USG9_9DEIN|nr:MAG: hypothetical protein AVDCRST_MAG86-341 [uncultured Truepera sp.]